MSDPCNKDIAKFTLRQNTSQLTVTHKNTSGPMGV